MKSNSLIFLAICTGILSINITLLSAAKPVAVPAPVPVCTVNCTPEPQGGSLKGFQADYIANCMNMGNTYSQCK